ncbi:MAG: hypothetical protein RL308_103 [Bacteroidota bacterium]|jgi:uncharacterized membrane protein YeaQ/YmgE (transglycosylase-associated protein family)
MLEFIISIAEEIIGALIVLFIIKKDKKKWLEEHPLTKHKIDLSFYFYHKYLFCTIFPILFAIFGACISLFDPNYDTLPRFTAAWITFGLGLSATILFKHINKDFNRPVRPL